MVHINGRISFARVVPATNDEEIFSIRADGSDEQQLTFDPPGHNSLFSDWSPDGSRITFDSDRFNNGTDDAVDIFTMKADGSDIVQLTSDAGFNGEPEYSPDGMKIAFESDRGGGFPLQGIYVMNASDGSNVHQVTSSLSGEFDAIPHFAPDGTRIAFTGARGCRFKGNGRFQRPKGCLAAVYVVNIDGSGLTRITPWGFDTGVNDWSPDGTKIAFNTGFDAHPGSTIDIYVVNPDGKHLTNLTNNPPDARRAVGDVQDVSRPSSNRAATGRGQDHSCYRARAGRYCEEVLSCSDCWDGLRIVRHSAISNSRLRCDQESHCEHERFVRAMSRGWFRTKQVGRVVATRDERRY
jgi:Tol biopolymer transport system component